MTSRPVWAVLACAGLGLRAGGEVPKQFQTVAGQRVMDWSLQALLAIKAVAGVMVVLPPGHSEKPLERVHYCSGGATRAASVLAGLSALQTLGAEADDLVLVHDAARPCVPKADILRLLSCVQPHSDGGLLALPLRDTLKQADRENARVQQTVPRGGLWQALTPQCFPLKRLMSALAQAVSEPVTDEAEAMEKQGAKPLLVAGSSANIKLTYPDDFALAEAWLTGARP